MFFFLAQFLLSESIKLQVLQIAIFYVSYFDIVLLNVFILPYGCEECGYLYICKWEI